MVWGVIHAKSVKQKLNTKILTKSEVVGTSEYFTDNIWLIMLLLDQGYRILNNKIYKGNQITIKWK